MTGDILLTLGVVSAAIALYVLIAYFLLPAFWTFYDYAGGLRNEPMRTVTGQGIPGDPLNVGLVGSEADLIAAFSAAGWRPADPITLKSSLKIAESVVFDRPDPDAPVSNLFYQGRRQDLAFEKPAAASADRRHHVRFWRVLDETGGGHPLWLGSATFDKDVGLSHYTGQVTHHIDANIDAERDQLTDDLTTIGWVTGTHQILGVGPMLRGRNGGGDPFYTDGLVTIGELRGPAPTA